MALALVKYEDFSSLLEVTFMVQKGLDEMGIGQPLSYEYSHEGIVPFERGVPTSTCHRILAALTC